MSDGEEVVQGLHAEDFSDEVPVCLSVGAVSEQNPRFRRHMEDAHVVKGNFGGDSRRAFVGVYDGHGGSDASNHIASCLHDHFLKQLRTRPNTGFPELIARAYVEADKELAQLDMQQQGSTVVTCYVAPDTPLGNGPSDPNSPLKLYTANAGDARAVLCRGGRGVRLSYDHKASDEAEAARVQECGGFIVYGRVNAILSVSRALGDHALKESVLPYPHTSEVELTPEDEFVIIACDGLWDVMSDQQAAESVRHIQDAKKMSERLVTLALEAGTTDNISVVCMRFQNAVQQ